MSDSAMKKAVASSHFEDRFAPVNAAMISTTGMLKKAIKNNPGMALLVSASIGVILACLSKRR